jgi:hypothetical protein
MDKLQVAHALDLDLDLDLDLGMEAGQRNMPDGRSTRPSQRKLWHGTQPIRRVPISLLLPSQFRGPFGRAFPSASPLAFTEALPNP